MNEVVINKMPKNYDVAGALTGRNGEYGYRRRFGTAKKPWIQNIASSNDADSAACRKRILPPRSKPSILRARMVSGWFVMEGMKKEEKKKLWLGMGGAGGYEIEKNAAGERMEQEAAGFGFQNLGFHHQGKAWSRSKKKKQSLEKGYGS